MRLDKMQRQFLGLVLIAAGALLVIFCLGSFMLQVLGALCGLYLINMGFLLRGEQSLRVFAWRWYHRLR